MSRIPTLSDLDVKDKKVLVRVDFNVPLDSEGAISDDTRIVASLPTIQHLLKSGAKVILMSHLGRPKGKSASLSLSPCAKRLSELLGIPVKMAPDCVGDEVKSLIDSLKQGQCLLLENLRFYKAEEEPEIDPEFAKKLASLADLYVNDAFGTAHRAHSSTATIAAHFPNKKAAGSLLEKEIAFLGEALKNPKRPFYAIIGGAKVSSKLGVLLALVQKVDVLLIGGGMSYTFLKAQGVSVGDSMVENDMLDKANEILNACKKNGVQLFLPLDVVAACAFDNNAEYKTFDIPPGISDGFQGMDTGPKTVAIWKNELKKAKTVLWNGPVGAFELDNFSKGTFELAKAVASLDDAITIIGGGDSVAAVQRAGLADKMTHISTGGGASLEYLEFGSLPGLDALITK